jgi:hypothetical protein
VHAHIGGELAWLKNGGRTIWDVFRKTRFLGNTRVDTCSRVLKREPIEAWLTANCDPANTVMHIGIDWTEEHRWSAIQAGWARSGWTTQALLIEERRDKWEALEWLQTAGIQPPELTRKGFPHANCGGGCVRAGQGQFAALYKAFPDEFDHWETEEAGMRTFLERDDVAILRDRRGGGTAPLTLTELRRRVDIGEIAPDLGDGACNCMAPTLFDELLGIGQ